MTCGLTAVKRFWADVSGMSRIDAGVILVFLAIGAFAWYYLFGGDEEHPIVELVVRTAEASELNWAYLAVAIAVAVIGWSAFLHHCDTRDSRAQLVALEKELTEKRPQGGPKDDLVDAGLLETHVLSAWRAAIGRQLISIVCHTLEYEIEAEDEFEAEWFYFGGEMEFLFEPAHSVFVSWQQNAGFKDRVSIQATRTTTFKTDSLAPYDISSTTPWSAFFGRPLDRLDVWGDEDGPCVIALHFLFSDRRLIIAQGIGGDDFVFGKGDDVIVTATLADDKLNGLERLATLP